MVRIVLGAVVMVMLAACASKSNVSVPKPTINSIAIIPALSPVVYKLENRDAVVTGLFPMARYAYEQSNLAKSLEFSKMLNVPQFSPGAEMTNAIVEGLRSRGYVIEILGGVSRNPVHPEDIDYTKLSHKSDAVLHLFFSEVGLYSPPTSANYFPRVNASGRLIVKSSQEYLYDETIYYGVDARAGKSWAIVADEKLIFPDYDYVRNNIELVRSTFSAGVREVSKRMAEQIHATIK